MRLTFIWAIFLMYAPCCEKPLPPFEHFEVRIATTVTYKDGKTAQVSGLLKGDVNNTDNTVAMTLTEMDPWFVPQDEQAQAALWARARVVVEQAYPRLAPLTVK